MTKRDLQAKTYPAAKMVAPWVLVFGLVAGLFTPSPAEGQSSHFPLAYSARLTNANGSPLNGPIDVDVKFYSAETGGTQLGNVYPYTGVFPVEGVMNLNINLMPLQVEAIFGDGSQAVYIEITAEGKTYQRQRYSFVPLALRVPVDKKTLSFGDDGKLGLSLKTLPATNQFLTQNASGELVWGTPATVTASSIRGRNVSASLPSAGQVLTYSGTEWVPQTLSGSGSSGGTLGVAGGGTGATSFANNGVLVGAGSGPVSATAAGTAGNVLTVGTSGPEFGRVDLSSSAAVTGALSLGNGGTGANLSTTGGTGQYLQQTSAGAVISVGAIPPADITASLGYTPVSKSGDVMSGELTVPVITQVASTAPSLSAAGQGKIYFDQADSEFKISQNGSPYTKLAAGGSVTSVNTGAGLTGGPITGTGTISLSTTGVTAGSYNRASIEVDAQGRITGAVNGANINLASEVANRLAVSNGGTGATSFTSNGVVLGNGTDNLFTTGSGTPDQVLRVPNGGGVPSFGAINLASVSAVSGLLPLAHGGTGANLAGTGGSGQFLKQTSSGGAVTVAAISASEIPALPANKIPLATSTADGYLSATDWTAFSNKQASGNYLTALTGDITASGPGSATASLSPSGVTAGTYAKVSVDAKGRVITGYILDAADLPPLSASLISSGILAPANGGTGVNSTATYPSSGVVATRDAAETLTNKTLAGANINGASSIGGSTTINTTGSVTTGALTAATVTSQGNVTVSGSGTVANKLVLNNKTNTNYVAFKAPDVLNTQLTWELPSVDGTSGQVLSTNGSGTLSWVSGVAPTGTASGDLTGNYPGPTLATVGTAGTYTKVTTDSKGRVISGATLSSSDLPPISATSLNTGTLAVANGGTGVGSFTNNGVVIGSSSALSSTAAGTQYNILTVSAGNQPTFGTVNLASSNAVNGTLGLANGGTGATTKSGAFDALSPMTAAGDLIYGGTSGAGTKLAGNTTATKQFLTSTGTGSAANAPAWAALTAADIPALNASMITSGALAIANGGTGTGSTNAKYVFAGPTSGSGAPSFRALVAGDYPAMVGANGTDAGTAGAVPGPAATDNVKFLRGDGTWANPPATAAGSTNQIQYNSGGALTGNANFVYSGGNVGIGTTAPNSALEVNGQIRSNYALTVRNPNNYDASAQLSWLNDIPRLRWGGTSPGGANGFDFQGPGDTSYLRITSAGNVGIGTTAPASTMETVGVAHVHDASVGPDNGYNGALRVTRAAATGQYINLTRMGNYVWSLGTVYNTSNFAIGTGQATDSSFNSPFFTINTSGNVGIGTTVPTAGLEIGLSSGQPAFKTASLMAQGFANNTWLADNLYYNGSSWVYGANGYANRIRFLNGDMTFSVAGNNTSGPGAAAVTSTAMTILNNGNVGIGTTSPGSILHLNGANPSITLQPTAGGPQSGIQFVTPTNTAGMSIGRDRNSTGTNDMFFYDQVAGATRMYISSTGNVGIGSTSPTAQLDVAGDVKTSGSISYGPFKDFRMVFQDTFESAATGWSTTTRSACGPSTILGGYNVLSTTSVSRTFDLTGIPHSEVMVRATYYFIDTWDSEWGYMKLDGYPVWSRQHLGVQPGNGSFCGLSNNYDLAVTVLGSLPHSGNSLVVLFGSNLDSVATDESYGVDNVEVWVR